MLRIMMNHCYILEYKVVDSKGREKTPKHAGVFKNIEKLEEEKLRILQSSKNRISFQVYVNESFF